MILALVFLLFTSFVGSTVLVSATANAYRVKHLSDQQAFLTERSAALLMTDQLQLEDNQRLQLIVVDSDLIYKEVTVGNGGVVTETATAPYQTRRITFQVVTNIANPTPLQKLQLEMAVWRMLAEKGVSLTEANGYVSLVNFLQGEKLENLAFQPDATQSDPFTGTLTVSAIPMPVTFQADKGQPEQNLGATGVAIPTYTATFSCGTGDELYDFRIAFGSGSQLKVNMNAFYGVGKQNIIESPARQFGSTKPSWYAAQGWKTQYYTLTTKSVQTVISWEDPMLEKGDAV